MLNSLFKNKKNIIPFKNDLLFHFFNKKTQITDTYLLDPISNLKLYPKKSNNLVTTSVNTQFHVAKELVDYTQGFEISMDVYYNPTGWTLTNYNAVCGRGNGTLFPSGMFMPGVFVNSFFGKWKSGTLSQISATGLTADWYRYRMIVTATTCQIKLLNLRTGIELGGGVATVGTDTTSEDKNFTFLCFGIDGATGAFGSVGVNISNIRITRNLACILNVPLSEGVSDKVTDVCNSSQYQITFFTVASGWAKLSNYYHYNYKYGFTLYQKTGENNLYIPNTTAQTEITITPPSGYSRVTNYKECRQSFNQCESVFVLDNTTVASVLRCTTAGTADAIGDYVYNSTNSRWVNTTTGAYIYYQSEATWYWKTSAGALMYYGTAYTTPENVTVWQRSTGAIPAPSQLQSVLITTDLYDADVDFILFTENTGVAKEINIGTLDVNIGIDRGYLYINPNIQEHDFMLYGTNKTLLNDVKVLKYIGLGDEIIYDESGNVVYDENDHTVLGE